MFGGSGACMGVGMQVIIASPSGHEIPETGWIPLKLFGQSSVGKLITCRFNIS